MNKLPSLEDIRVFVTVARLMSFSQAASQLLVSPAYVSKRIKLLEENLGQTLFFRTARSIKLTHEGQIILRSSEVMLAELEQMQQQLNACREEIRGSLRISCSTGFGSTYINPFILTLRGNYPLLGIDLTLTDKSVDIISENIDVDICIGGAIAEQFIARRIAQNQRILCASPTYLAKHGYPKYPQELEQKHFCIAIKERNQAPAVWKLEQQQESMTVTPNSKLTVNNGEVAKQWCLSGEGILLRSQWSVQPELQSGQLVRVLPQWHQTADVYAVYSRSLRTSANLRVFIENLEQYLATHLSHGF
ncbi:LysR substrate-binding domain-containing protein [Providencia rettgeri]|uniref:LysR substrate-binding domain-containing protein n=1 Tax=Providencia TaxID=586 RepID=UPI000D7E8817|nr:MULTISPECIES: LysR substrate-binding domain-containing protein [Providencia]AWS49433.1 LysR family transcriptional regulator [Providencia rettgeri]MBS0918143.1 LysR family transcriptional regulator [Providencia rettgeri]MCG5291270.1 LysR substrate-binding domain-containing protein [Providencia rettgeri]MCG5379698.1 LysR substrate-binding domain-containing protein [Providencia rettgeri]MCK9998978.1 LysR substrate-binding domain-containing protein [Providencia rettgeri]